ATVYSDVIEDRLKSLNTSISIKLQQRITEFEAQNPDCFERIFETKSLSAMGISYQYPELYYPLDSILTHLASTGLPSTWNFDHRSASQSRFMR
ncbi:unnamed protein product, partial [Allacma fusca]